jgi:type I restriction enzyme S subunit
MVASHRFPMYVAIPNITDIDYLIHFFLTKKGKNLLELASPGGAGRNKTLGQKEFENLNFSIPSYAEQTKIALFLTTLNNKLQQLKKKKELLEQYKKGVMQQIFYQELRFKNDKGKDYADWENKTLGDVLDYVQPTKYLVSSKEYSNKYKTPVLTAGKTFILGYTNETKNIFNENLPVIIFDDFTTATQFVDFPFKAKSSAMKILVAKDSVNIKFIYEAMQMLRYEIGGHERHWISKYSPLEFDLPCPEEQTKIANFLSSIDDKINAVKQQIEKTQVWKNGLLQKMFV